MLCRCGQADKFQLPSGSEIGQEETFEHTKVATRERLLSDLQPAFLGRQRFRSMLETFAHVRRICLPLKSVTLQCKLAPVAAENDAQIERY